MHSMRLFTVLHPREKLRRFNHDVGMFELLAVLGLVATLASVL
jgi:hypothetical protein